MDPYVAGVLVGIGSAAVVIAVMAAVRKKNRANPGRSMTNGSWPPGASPTGGRI